MKANVYREMKPHPTQRSLGAPNSMSRTMGVEREKTRAAQPPSLTHSAPRMGVSRAIEIRLPAPA